jgi:(2Fe-2S) ferredoxin
MGKLNSFNELNELRETLKKETFKPDALRARVCCGTACTATGAFKVIESFKEESAKTGVDIDIVKTGCQGICQKGPVLKVEPLDIFYQRTKPVNVPWIMSYSVLGNLPYRQGLYRDNFLSEPIPVMTDIPFYKKQKRIALRNNGKIDPCNISHYIAVDGYAALEKALSSMSPCGGEAVQGSRPAGNGHIRKRLPALLSLLLPTVTKVTREHLWTGPLWRVTLTVSLKEWPSVHMRLEHSTVLYMSGMSIPLLSKTFRLP